ncbi:MAG: cytochrome-c peroxidase, partial [Bacteroidia bacterium]
TFERSLISANSPYDRYAYKGAKSALNNKAKKGYDLFFSDKTGCFNCHSGFNFTNYAFENNGLYNNYENEGRKRITGKNEDYALFKVPTLRNVEVTAPYMHDGSINTLEEVIEHYNAGGSDFYNKNELIKPLGLTQKEKANLLAFLKSLTDECFLSNSKLKLNER